MNNKDSEAGPPADENTFGSDLPEDGTPAAPKHVGARLIL
jgi:hypothetical protein